MDQDKKHARERQFQLDRLVAGYLEKLQAGSAPRLADFIAEHPEFASDLVDMVFYFLCVAVDLPEPGAEAAAELSPAAKAALAHIHQELELREWGLIAGYTVTCVRCHATLEVLRPTEDEAIKALKTFGYVPTAVGPWCPACKPLLYVRRGRSPAFHPGDEVIHEVDRTSVGVVIRINDAGYTEVRAPDGSVAVYATGELEKRP